MDNKTFVSDETGSAVSEQSTGNTDSKTELAGPISTLSSGDDEKGKAGAIERDRWGKEIEFLFSCIALSVGLGNVWRFPFVALENGGGAFVIPYIIVLFLVGKPIYYMEMLLGQFSSRGSIKLYDFAPLLRGVGYGQVFATSCISTYYAALMALTLRYLVASFSSVLPWSYCREEWGDSCIASGFKGNLSGEGKKVPSAQFYFTHVVLKEKVQIDDGIGEPNWELTICLFVTWALISAIIIKGIRSSGKVSYFLALFPYVIMIVLLGRAMTLPGAADGVLYFITPQWNKLITAQVWYAAVTQVFFSLTTCFGIIVIYASYNKFDHNIYRDCNIITSMDTFTSMLSGVIIFGILGNLAYETQSKDIATVVQGGTGLAFISYPDAIAKFATVPQVFSVLFFLMLFILGLGSNVGVVTCLLTVAKDQFSNTKHWVIVAVLSTYGFLIGLVYLTPGGQFILNFVDFFGVTFIILCLAIAQLIAVGWVYGVKRFCADIEFMLQRKTGIYYRICWGIITPAFMAAVLIYTLVDYKPLQYNGYTYSKGLQILGWCISAFGIAQVFFWGARAYRRTPKGPYRLMRSLKPKTGWGPLDAELLKSYQDSISENQLNEKKKGLTSKILENLFR